VKKEDAGRLRHHRYPLGWAQVLALDHSEKSGGPPGSGPPARGRTSSNDHRHDRGKRHSGARSPGCSRVSEVIGFKPGDHVKILGGPFRGHLALCAGMKSHQRVEVLLALLGSQQRAILPRADVEALATI
jgi:transcription antitermination factor NusG